MPHFNLDDDNIMILVPNYTSSQLHILDVDSFCENRKDSFVEVAKLFAKQHHPPMRYMLVL